MTMAVVEYLAKDRIAYITLNRPEKRNALNPEVINSLKDAVRKAEADAGVKVVVLRAAGDAFCAGADLGYLQQLQSFSYEENLADSRNLKELFLSLYELEKVVIGQVHGPALAGGCGLATVCDFVFATPDATFGYTEVRIGFIPAIVMIFLLRKLGEARSRDLLLTGRIVKADEARDIGLVYRVVEKATLEKEVEALAKKLIETASGQSLALTKRMIGAVQQFPLELALDFAAEQNAKARGTEDCRKGIDAFLNKRDIRW